MPLRTLLPVIALALAMASMAQPTWRFHLAFEDGTGAKDTIWMVYDTTATLGTNPWPGLNVDTLLGEGRVDIDDGLFHVFRTNAIGDTTQTNAYPYSWFPIFDGTIIDAINWTPPMTIRWDTSLFHAPYLPYDQGSFGIAIMGGLAFSAYNNHPELGFDIYDMLISDSITVDFLWDYLFPFGTYFGEDQGVGISEPRTSTPFLSIHPNPAQTTLDVRATSPLGDIRVLDLSGRTVRLFRGTMNNATLDIASLSPGTYIVLAHSPQNQLYHGKFQKIE